MAAVAEAAREQRDEMLRAQMLALQDMQVQVQHAAELGRRMRASVKPAAPPANASNRAPNTGRAGVVLPDLLGLVRDCALLVGGALLVGYAVVAGQAAMMSAGVALLCAPWFVGAGLHGRPRARQATRLAQLHDRYVHSDSWVYGVEQLERDVTEVLRVGQ